MIHIIIMMHVPYTLLDPQTATNVNLLGIIAVVNLWRTTHPTNIWRSLQTSAWI